MVVPKTAATPQAERQASVKITVTGREIAVLEREYANARQLAEQYASHTRDGAGSLTDMARGAAALREAAVLANALYVLTGSLTWRDATVECRSAASVTYAAMAVRERGTNANLVDQQDASLIRDALRSEADRLRVADWTPERDDAVARLDRMAGRLEALANGSAALERLRRA